MKGRKLTRGDKAYSKEKKKKRRKKEEVTKKKRERKGKKGEEAVRSLASPCL